MKSLIYRFLVYKVLKMQCYEIRYENGTYTHVYANKPVVTSVDCYLVKS